MLINKISFLILILNIIINLKLINTLNSYIYLKDKFINEELQIGTQVADLYKELNDEKQKNQLNIKQKIEFTLLDDSKSSSTNSYFTLNSTTGLLKTNQKLDREYLCLNRLCADQCELGLLANSKNENNNQQLFSCRLNIKIVLMPSYNILNMNIFIQDINDNRPKFKNLIQTHKINENVPIGFKIPIELAYDPDIGLNTIQSYELLNNDDRSFKLEQNLNESQLYLVVQSHLDREIQSIYNLNIKAIDRPYGLSIPESDLNESILKLNIELIDMNDNNPMFDKNLYKFNIQEDAQVNTIIGIVKATDLDEGLNGLINYKIVDSTIKLNTQFSQSNGLINKYFYLNKTNGELRLKNKLDYEIENFFNFQIEAKDSGVGSLPAYTNVEINVLDINDNRPEINVNFLNSLFKNESKLDEFKYDLYLPENTKENKFLAHVSILDKDSSENGRLDWKIILNDKKIIACSYKTDLIDESILKLVKLSTNSFTLNIASSKLLDYELNTHFNLTIIAWDYGMPKLDESIYKFRILLIDLNDNPPRFENDIYNLTLNENNDENEFIFKLNAYDDDLDKKNSLISYSIVEDEYKDYFRIDQDGNLYAKIKFDREKRDDYRFNVIAVDNGIPSLSSNTLVNLKILDQNDNKPIIKYHSQFKHYIDNNNRLLYIKINRNLGLNQKLVEFNAIDYDLDDNSRVEFYLNIDEKNKTFDLVKMNKNGVLYLNKNLLNYKNIQKIDLEIICKDLGDSSLNTSLIVRLDILNESNRTDYYCINNENNLIDLKSKFINKDEFKYFTGRVKIFEINYNLEKLTTSSINKLEQRLSVELLTHQDLFQLNLVKSKLEIYLNFLNNKNLTLGKYSIKIRLIDNFKPTCVRLDLFSVLIGNNLINENDLKSLLKSIKLNHLKTKHLKTSKLLLNEEYDDMNENELHNEILLSHNNNNSSSDLVKKRDSILLIILILIIILTSIFLTFFGIVCIYSRYFKNKKNSIKKYKSVSNLDKNFNSKWNNDEQDERKGMYVSNNNNNNNDINERNLNSFSSFGGSKNHIRNQFDSDNDRYRTINYHRVLSNNNGNVGKLMFTNTIKSANKIEHRYGSSNNSNSTSESITFVTSAGINDSRSNTTCSTTSHHDYDLNYF